MFGSGPSPFGKPEQKVEPKKEMSQSSLFSGIKVDLGDLSTTKDVPKPQASTFFGAMPPSMAAKPETKPDAKTDSKPFGQAFGATQASFSQGTSQPATFGSMMQKSTD